MVVIHNLGIPWLNSEVVIKNQLLTPNPLGSDQSTYPTRLESDSSHHGLGDSFRDPDPDQAIVTEWSILGLGSFINFQFQWQSWTGMQLNLHQISYPFVAYYDIRMC